jgi:hypothetical protein
MAVPHVARAGSRPSAGGHHGGAQDVGLSATPRASSGSSASRSTAINETTGSTGSPAPDISGSASASSSGLPTGSDAASSRVDAPVLSLDRPHTRMQSGVYKPKKLNDGTI